MSELIGSVGVFLLLAAYFANLRGMLDRGSRLYQSMNAVGAGLSAYASYLIGFLPFVVLEATWLAVSVAELLRPATRTGSGAGAA